MSVTDLADRRRDKEQPYDGLLCLSCGSPWFDAVVLLSGRGYINCLRSELLKCHDCGEPARASGVI